MGIVSRVVDDQRLWDEAVAIAAAAIALENRNQDLANKSDEVRAYVQRYAAPRKKTERA